MNLKLRTKQNSLVADGGGHEEEQYELNAVEEEKEPNDCKVCEVKRVRICENYGHQNGLDCEKSKVV